MAESRTPTPAAKAAATPMPRLSPAEFAQENQQTDRLLAFLLVLLAFLLAAFPIVDSRFWQSLRTGQLIDLGQFDFRSDPFSFTTAGQFWSHPGWLADWFFYRLFEAVGGGGVVFFRALVMVFITLLMLSFQKKGRGLATLVAVLLAVLAVAPRLWVRPELFSLLFLPLTLWLLNRPAEPSPTGLLAPVLRWTKGRWWVFLPPLFALWANLDEWFFLGPLTALLWWLGTLLEPVGPGDAAKVGAERRALLAVVAAGFLACLLNPYHIHAFKIPGELHSPALTLLNKEFAGRKISISPFSPDLFNESRVMLLGLPIPLQPFGLTLCEWAYFPLALLGAFSFLVHGNVRRCSRLIVWAAFFAISAYQTRNIGFFAVVAGPLAVLNLQDWLAARAAHARPSVTRGRAAGALAWRFLTLLFLLIACGFCVLPSQEPLFAQLLGEPTLGNLNPRGSLGFSAFADPSMKNVAQWRHSHMPPSAGQPFHLNFAEPAGYEAWFNPGSKTFLDFRYELHGAAAAEFWDAYEALRETRQPSAPALLDRWRAVFRKHDISHLIVSNRTVQRPDPNNPKNQLAVPLYRLLYLLQDEQGKRPFELLSFIDGNHFVFAWTESPHYSKLKALKLAPDELIFRRPHAPPPKSEPPPAEQSTPLGLFLAGNVTRKPTGLDGAGWWQSQYEADRSQARFYYLRQGPLDVLTHVLLSQASQGAMIAAGMPLPSTLLNLEKFSPSQNYEALEQARQAIAAVPDKNDTPSQFYRAEGYRALANAYESISDQERGVSRGLPIPLREFQITAARRQAAAGLPNLPMLHEQLALRYLTRRGPTGAVEPFLDIGLFHLLDAIDLYKSQGQLRGRPASPQEIETELRIQINQRFGLKVDDLEKAVKERQAAFAQQAPKRTEVPNPEVALRRAMMAAQIGLVGAAEVELRDAFASTDPAALKAALTFGADLYLGLGMLPELLEKLRHPLAQEAMGTSRWRQFSALAEAAAGNPATAAALRAAHAAELRLAASRNLLQAGRLQTLGGFAEPLGSSLIGQYNGLEASLALSRQIAEQLVMQGLNLIEAGDPQGAAKLFREAIRDLDPASPFVGLAGRYYFLITGDFLDADLKP